MNPWSRSFERRPHINFPNDTGSPTLALTATSLTAGQSTVQYKSLVGQSFKPSGTVIAYGSIVTYTGVTVSTATTGTLTGCVGVPLSTNPGGAP